MEYLQSYLGKIKIQSVQTYIDQIVQYVAGLIWLDYNTTQLILLWVITYIVFIVIVVLIHKWFLRRGTKIKALCTRKYDELRYLASTNMYKFNKEMKAQWKENQLVYGAKSIIWLENKNYIANKQKIFGDLAKLEWYIGKSIVSSELKNEIVVLDKKITTNHLSQKVVGRILTILTLGIYKLVR